MTLIKSNGGRYNSEIKTAFLKNSEELVIKELAEVQVTLSKNQLNFIRHDPAIYEACYATIRPPDPRILLNILELRKELGPDFFDEYKNLLIAGAVVRRYTGLGQDAFGDKEEWALRTRTTKELKTKRREWPQYTVVAIKQKPIPPKHKEETIQKNKKTPSARKIKKRQDKWEKSKSKLVDAEGKKIVYEFLVEKKITPRQLQESSSLQKELLSRMGDKAPAWGKIDYHMLMEVMTAYELRPAERDPFPSMAEFARYLDEIKPNFPIKKAPWPIMMPLAKGWPLREARQIWKNYEKSGNLPTYGKYRKKNLVIQSRLEPMPWHWKSWQGVYQAGGVCHEMSTIGLGAYMSVGVPTCKAGQPHHSCILVFNYKNNAFSAKTRQGTKGPSATRSQWLFADPDVEKNQLYHIGLALSMNQGLSAYMDSRIGLHIANQLIQKNDIKLAQNMLISVLRINPYNTEVWQKLNSLRMPDTEPVLHKAQMIHLLSSLISSSNDAVTEFKEKAVNISLADEKDDNTITTNPKSGASNYVNIMSKMWFRPIDPVKDRQTNIKILSLLNASKGSGIPVEEYISDFEVSINGWESLKQPIIDAAQKYAKLRENNLGLAKNTSMKIKSAVKFADNDRELLAWLLQLEDITDKKMTYKRRPKTKKVYGDQIYTAVNYALADLLTKMKQPAEAAAYRIKLQKAIAAAKR